MHTTRPSKILRADAPDADDIVRIAYEKHLAICGPGQGDRLRLRFSRSCLKGIV